MGLDDLPLLVGEVGLVCSSHGARNPTGSPPRDPFSDSFKPKLREQPTRDARGSTSRFEVGQFPYRSTRPKAPPTRGSCDDRKSAPRAPRPGARRPMPRTTACRGASARRPGTPPIWRPSGASAGAALRTSRPVPYGFALVSQSLPDLPDSQRTSSLANHRTCGCPWGSSENLYARASENTPSETVWKIGGVPIIGALRAAERGWRNLDRPLLGAKDPRSRSL